MSLWVVLNAAVERIGGSNLPRIRQDHQFIFLGSVEIDSPDQGEAVEDKRQAAASPKVRLVRETEMQMGAAGGAAVSYLGDARPSLYRVSNLYRETAGLQMSLERKDVGGDFENHVIAAKI